MISVENDVLIKTVQWFPYTGVDLIFTKLPPSYQMNETLNYRINLR